MALTWLISGPGQGWRDLPRSWRWGLGAGAAAVLVSAAGIFVAPADAGTTAALTRYLRQVIQLVVMLAFTLWPVAHLRGLPAWRRMSRWLVAGALLQASYGLLQQVGYQRPSSLLAELEQIFTSNPSILSGSAELYVGNRFLEIPRLRGTACEPLYLGNYLLLALPVIALTAWPRAVRAAAAGVLSLLLLLTWSRGAWLGALGGLAMAMWWVAPTVTAAVRRRRRRLWFILGGGAAVLLLTAAAVGWESVLLPARRLAQTFSTNDWSNLTRLYSMQAAWRAFTLSPVVGIGWGQFGWHFPALVDPAGLQAMFTWPVVANFPLLVLCETGLLGGAAVVVCLGGLLREVVRCRRTLAAPTGATRHPWLPVGASAVAGAAIAVQTMTFAQYNLPHAWVALGLLMAALLEARAAAGQLERR
jgi:O-antigen ligase